MESNILRTARPDVLKWAFEIRDPLKIASALAIITAFSILLALSWQDSISSRARRLSSYVGASCQRNTQPTSSLVCISSISREMQALNPKNLGRLLKSR